MSREPRLRADARRNRVRVLEAAQAAFEAEGVNVPLDDIARRAGVGAGTVYRHFPTKEALFAAVVDHRLEQLADEAGELLTADADGAAFFELFQRIAERAVLNRALCDALFAGTGEPMAKDHPRRADLRSTMDTLLRRAQRSGTVRADVTGDHVFAAIAGALTMERQSGGGDGHMTAIVLDGLRRT
ncbi:MAG TPA: helix-turn-helix domain-containing protein [Mycobacteriales bacterium]|nr:helix-turn-helix domain-containing protein [Mycobacteriales bacterium]